MAIAGRDRARTEDTAREIRAAAGGNVDVFVADLSSQAQVRRLADEVLEGLPRIDVLVNIVGGYWSSRHVTEDGLERTFALNHLASFLLTNLLLERLERNAPARVVTVASHAQATGRIDFDDLQGMRSYCGGRAYSQSKLANVLFTYQLAGDDLGPVEVVQYNPVPQADSMRSVLDTTVADLTGAIEFSLYGPVTAVLQVRLNRRTQRRSGPQRSEDTRRPAERSEALD